AVLLADDDDGAVAVESGVDGLDADRSACVDRHDHRGVQHRAADRADRYGLLELVVGAWLGHYGHLAYLKGLWRKVAFRRVRAARRRRSLMDLSQHCSSLLNRVH